MERGNDIFAELFDDEFKKLTDIGNNYRIRHHEQILRLFFQSLRITNFTSNIWSKNESNYETFSFKGILNNFSSNY